MTIDIIQPHPLQSSLRIIKLFVQSSLLKIHVVQYFYTRKWTCMDNFVDRLKNHPLFLSWCWRPISSPKRSLPDYYTRVSPLTVARRFSQILRRQISLNHLCQAARSVVHNPDISAQMLEDWISVDLSGIIKQTIYTMGRDREKVLETIVNRKRQPFLKIYIIYFGMDSATFSCNDEIIKHCISFVHIYNINCFMAIGYYLNVTFLL